MIFIITAKLFWGKQNLFGDEDYDIHKGCHFYQFLTNKSLKSKMRVLSSIFSSAGLEPG